MKRLVYLSFVLVLLVGLLPVTATAQPSAPAGPPGPANPSRESRTFPEPPRPEGVLLLEQLPNQVDGYFADSQSPQSIAENFSLAEEQVIEQVQLWSGYFSFDTPFSDNITIMFHDDAGGVPGTVLYSETPVASAREQTGVILFGVHEYLHTLTLATPLALGPGTYWVEIYNNNPGDDDIFFWETGNADSFGRGLLGYAWAPSTPGAGWLYDTGAELAFRLIGSDEPEPCVWQTVWAEDFEGGYGSWSMDGLWNPENEADACGALVAPFPSSTNDAYYGIDGQCTYDNGTANSGSLTMLVDADLIGASDAEVAFGSYEQTECGGDCGYDNRSVEVSADGGATWVSVGEGYIENGWYGWAGSLTSFAGGTVRVRFRFDTGDDFGNGYFGWMVDNVEIRGCFPGSTDPDISVTPESLYAEQCADEVTQQTLTICNEGGEELTWSLAEQPAPLAGGIDSLSGSYVAFDPSAGGDACYTPGTAGTFCFRAHSFSPDWEYIYNVWQKFPSDWTVANVYVQGTPYCAHGTWGSFSWSFETSPNEVNIYHPRYQANYPDENCIAYYCFEATPGVGGDASWYWDGDGYNNTPHHPCSADQYTPASMSAEPCDEWANPLATVPACMADIPWLSEDPTEGSLTPGACTDVAVSLDSAGMAPGDYFGDLLIDSNDPDEPQVDVPVQMDVIECNAFPDISVTPESLYAEQCADEVTSQILQVCNAGAADLTWTLAEQGAKQTALAPEGAPVVPHGASSNQPVQLHKARLESNPILVLATTFVDTVLQALNELGYAYDYVNATDWVGIDFAPYEVVIVGMDGGQIEAPSLLKIRTDVIDVGKRAIFLGGTCYQPFAIGVNQYLVLNDVNNYCWTVSSTPHFTVINPTDPLAQGLPSPHDFANSSAAYYQTRATDLDILTIALNGDGYADLFYKNNAWPVVEGSQPEAGGDLIWLINSPYYSYWADPNDYALLKQVLANSMEYGGAADIPWLSEDPVSGTVPAGECQDITVTFDSTGLAAGDYFASLAIDSNDPDEPQVIVPVQLTVLECGGTLTCGLINHGFMLDPYGRELLKWWVEAIDENGAIVPLVAVAADLTWPMGGPVSRTRLTHWDGYARFHWGSNLPGTWTIDVTNMTLAGYTFADGPQCSATAVGK